MPPQTYQPIIYPTIAPAPSAAPASLWVGPQNAQWSLIRDDKAMEAGDLVTVHLVTNTTAEESARTNSARSSDAEAGIENFLGLQQLIPMAIGASPSASDSRSVASTPLIKTNSSSNFSGDSSTNRSGKISGKITCLVTHVYPNGNLRIYGSEGVSINNERSILTLEGIVRPADITRDNTVLSTQIADSRIDYTGRGVISDVQRPGVMMRGFNNLWPF